MKILITGAAGFIGSHIVDELLTDNNYKLVVVDNLSTGNNNIPTNTTFYHADITNHQEVENIFKKELPDFVIHQAGQVDVTTSILNPLHDASINILGTISLLTNSQKYSVNKFIYASSCAVYGETKNTNILEDTKASPLSFYGISKYTPEQYIALYNKIYGLPYTILRYANVYGPRQTIKAEGGVVAIFIDHLLNGKSPQIFGDGMQTRDFVYVKDVAKANHLALFKGGNQVINIGSNNQISINTLYSMICDLTSSSNSPIYKPKRDGDIRYSQLDNTKAKQMLGWNPEYTLEEGLKETIKYYKSR
ncbi:NAD-dependent epimerase/dehydratase family protein [Oceanobacillus piezotolerans]|uniref:NAD-dependent epimerase/dehydratase family protein n=1 Tax=Oceanobacillus piezotolerans TaxID=2448030 RepID=A0A498DE26_9BACI|nr:NAD-dependent epimerase/dehydratase family protein [Oceanobacillus piezotolerans]RLL46920.1 NAD-dependent epimerase/dehydratase family protein [Oceanobacillus piezotolerans]